MCSALKDSNYLTWAAIKGRFHWLQLWIQLLTAYKDFPLRPLNSPVESLFLFSSLAEEEIEASRGEGIGSRPPQLAPLLLVCYEHFTHLFINLIL